MSKYNKIANRQLKILEKIDQIEKEQSNTQSKGEWMDLEQIKDQIQNELKLE